MRRSLLPPPAAAARGHCALLKASNRSLKKETQEAGQRCKEV